MEVLNTKLWERQMYRRGLVGQISISLCATMARHPFPRLATKLPVVNGEMPLLPMKLLMGYGLARRKVNSQVSNAAIESVH